MALTPQGGIEQAVPNSTGTAPPMLKAPANATDCHIHIYDPRFQPPVDEIVASAEMLRRLPTQIVFDHMGKVPAPDHPAFAVIRGLLDQRKAWVKISGAYMYTKFGPPRYADATEIAQAYVKAAPERCVWGSDWPHPGPKIKPDDANLFDLLSVWAPDEATRNRILVTNPETLYGFPRLA